MKKVLLPKKKIHVFFQDRHKMRKGHPAKRFQTPQVTIPEGPIDWAKSLRFPMDGNDQAGDCMVAAACHADNTWTGNVGTESTFDTGAILSWYRNLSGGDNGLDEGTLVTGWKRGLCNQANVNIIEALDVNTTDPQMMRAAIYLFGGVLFMFDVPDNWIQSFDTGALWDAPASPDPGNGHGVWENGINEQGNYKLLTWGDYVWITPAGQAEVDPAGFVCFSMRWFDPKTGYAPNGLHYTELADYWVKAGGSALPPSPFPAPTPGPTPTPPGPNPPGPTPAPSGNMLTLTTDLSAGSYPIGEATPCEIPCPTNDQWQAFLKKLQPQARKRPAGDDGACEQGPPGKDQQQPSPAAPKQ